MSGGASWMLSGTSGYESRDAKSGELYGTEQMTGRALPGAVHRLFLYCPQNKRTNRGYRNVRVGARRTKCTNRTLRGQRNSPAVPQEKETLKARSARPPIFLSKRLVYDSPISAPVWCSRRRSRHLCRWYRTRRGSRETRSSVPLPPGRPSGPAQTALQSQRTIPASHRR